MMFRQNFMRTHQFVNGYWEQKTVSLNTPVMFTKKEKAGESSSLWFAYLATIIIESGQPSIHRQVTLMGVDITFRFFWIVSSF